MLLCQKLLWFHQCFACEERLSKNQRLIYLIRVIESILIVASAAPPIVNHVNKWHKENEKINHFAEAFVSNVIVEQLPGYCRGKKKD